MRLRALVAGTLSAAVVASAYADATGLVVDRRASTASAAAVSGLGRSPDWTSAASPRRPLPAELPRPSRRASRGARTGLPAVPPPTARGCVDGSPSARGARALASLRPQWRVGARRVSFLTGRPGYLGGVDRGDASVSVFVRPCAQESDELLRHVVAHELGHAFDLLHLTVAERSAYRRARGIPADVPWFGCGGCADFATPAGDFAETYALWLRYGGTSRSRIAAQPRPAQLAALASRFFRP